MGALLEEIYVVILNGEFAFLLLILLSSWLQMLSTLLVIVVTACGGRILVRSVLMWSWLLVRCWTVFVYVGVLVIGSSMLLTLLCISLVTLFSCELRIGILVVKVLSIISGLALS